MTRKYPPTNISVAHTDTQVAELQRERAKPHVPVEPAPAAWEAPPEPAPPPQPNAARPKAVVVRERPADGSVVLSPEEAREVKRLLTDAQRKAGSQARSSLSTARRKIIDNTRGKL